MDSDRTKLISENDQQIQALREDLEKATAKLPPGFQQVSLPILVGQADSYLQEENGKGSPPPVHVFGGRVGYLSSLRTLLAERKDPTLTSEDYCFEQSSVAILEKEMLEAGEPYLLDEKDMTLFEQNLLSDPLQLVQCNSCSKPIRESHFAAHAARCLEQTAARREEEERDAAVAVALKPPRKGRKKNGDGDNACADGGAYPEDPIATANRGPPRATKRALNVSEGGMPKVARPRKSPAAGWQGGMEGAEGSGGVPTTPRGRTAGNAPRADAAINPKKQKPPLSRVPLTQAELDVCCGVVSSHSGAPCRRAITCKYHLEPVKKAVLGRSEPYSVLLYTFRSGGGLGPRNGAGTPSHPEAGGGTQGPPREAHYQNPVLTFPPPYRGPLPLATKTTSHHYPVYMRGVIGALFQDARLRANGCATPSACAASPKLFQPPPKLTVAQLAKPAAPLLSPPGAGQDPKKSRARSKKGPASEGGHNMYHSDLPEAEASLSRRFQQQHQQHQQHQQQQPGLMPPHTPTLLSPSSAQYPSHPPPPAAASPGLPPLPYAQGGPKPKAMRKESVKQQKLAHRVQEEEAMLFQQQQQQQGMGGMGGMGGQEGGGKMMYGAHMGRVGQMMVETGGGMQMHHMTTMADYPLLGSPGGQGLDHLGVGIQTMPDPNAHRQPQADAYHPHHRMLGMGMGISSHSHPSLGLNAFTYPAGSSGMPSPMHHQARQPGHPSPTGPAMLPGATGDWGHLP